MFTEKGWCNIWNSPTEVKSWASCWSHCFPTPFLYPVLFLLDLHSIILLLALSLFFLLLLAWTFTYSLFSVLKLFGGGLQTFPVEAANIWLEKKGGSWKEREEAQKPPLLYIHTLLDSRLDHRQTDHPTYDIALLALQSDSERHAQLYF